jgi:hypothetical protein
LFSISRNSWGEHKKRKAYSLIYTIYGTRIKGIASVLVTILVQKLVQLEEAILGVPAKMESIAEKSFNVAIL